MRIFVTQIYIEVGINFPFSHHFQTWVGQMLTKSVPASQFFTREYGNDFDLLLRLSAKSRIADLEIRGPTVFKNDKDVEYSIFLPYDVIKSADENNLACALDYFFRGVVKILLSLQMDATSLERNAPQYIKTIISEPAMFKTP